jgi:hypothetical protein
MIYAKEILDDILLDAKNGLSLIEISVRLGVPFDRFYVDYCNPETNVKRYYDHGQAEGKTKTDLQLYKLAQNGSVSAKLAYDKKMLVAHLANLYKEIDEL